MHKLIKEIDFESLMQEYRRSQARKAAAVETMIVADDDAPLQCVFDGFLHIFGDALS